MTWAGFAPSGSLWTINFGGGTARVDWEFPGGDLSGPIDNLLVVGIQGSPVSSGIPVLGDILQFDGSAWAPSTFGITDPLIVMSGSIVNLDSSNNRVIIKTGNSTTVNLPSSPLFGQELMIKDGDGSASTNTITILPPSGNTIDGVTTLFMSQDYQAYGFLWNGTEWNII